MVDVDDEELSDFVEYLVCEYQLAVRRPPTMVFASEVLNRVVAALLKLDPIEVERVFRISISATDAPATGSSP